MPALLRKSPQSVQILHTEISSCVLNNGRTSTSFTLNRGVKQGCPLFGLLFVLGLELLGRAINRNPLIQGITIENKEIKTTMYADDTTVFVSNTDSVLHLLSLLDKFRSTSGFLINTSNRTLL